MNEPAKDEAELMDAMVDAIWEYLTPETCWTDKPYVERDLRAAIRAAGWAVVPMEPTKEINYEIIVAMIDSRYITANEHEAAKIYRAAIRTAALRVKS
jgi:hypothetical protein